MSDIYYSDSYYQLELNLQETRRELIALIEACDLKDTFKETECSSDTEQKSKEQTKSPEVDILPKPNWNDKQPSPAAYDVQTWLQTCSLNNQLNPSDATTPKKALNFINTPFKKVVINALEGKITVDAFFKSFKDAKAKESNMEFDNITKSPNTGRDYAYF